MNRPRLPASALLLAALALAAGCNSKPSTDPAPEPGGGRPAPDPNGGPGESDEAKAEAQKRLRQIGLAMHNYESAMQQFPAGVVGPKGEVGLSWRVQILPYLEDAKETGGLYQQFNLKEPWDSEHNKKLIAKMPKVFASAGKEAPEGKTYLRSFAGQFGFVRMPPMNIVPKGKAPPPPFPNIQPGRNVPGQVLLGITDGTSNTLMVAEAAEPVEWTKPDEIPFHDYMPGNPKLPPRPKLGGVFEGGFHGLMCDGAVKFFPDTLKDATVFALISTQGGEVLLQDASDVLFPPKPKGAPAAVPADLPDAAARKTAVANLQKVVLGLHAHHDMLGAMPAGIAGPKRTVGLSWRVAVLPFIGEEKLFKEFNLKEPWDSEHNKALLEKMPAVFASPGKAAEKGHTFVRTTMGPGGIIRTVPPERLPAKGKPEPPPKIEVRTTYDPTQVVHGRKLSEFVDGLSNTILLVEAGEAVPWTKPDELFLPMLTPDPRTGGPPKDAKLPALGGVFADGFHAGMADGRVVFFKTGYPAVELAKLLGPADGWVTDSLDDPKKVPYVIPMAPVAKAPAGKTMTKP